MVVPVQVPCPICGEPFTPEVMPNGQERKYCGPDCRQEANRRHQRAVWKAGQEALKKGTRT